MELNYLKKLESLKETQELKEFTELIDMFNKQYSVFITNLTNS